MNSMHRWWVACVLAAALVLAGCGSEGVPPSPTPSATTDDAAAEEAAVLAAFARFWDEKVAIANSGEVPEDALSETATGSLREETIARFIQDVEYGTTRKGAPQFKDQKATVAGDTALVVACINEDDWDFVVQGDPEVVSNDGWSQLGSKLTKIDGRWLVSGYSPESTQETCP